MTPLGELVGESPGIVAVREMISRLLARQSEARRLPPILIQGETGTGKGLVARALHQGGPRPEGPFVDVNCAAIPETLLEAEMFGFERGAFTDARQAKRGLFQAAHRGTLFLDEVGLLPEGLQGKLLKAIEERAVRRLGSTRSEPVDAWVLTATSTDLVAAMRERRFREDLYHRLAVVTVGLPPLRERGEDILRLAERFLTRACGDYEVAAKSLTAAARAALLAYPWPGNVRELINVMERVALLSEERDVTPETLGLATPARPARDVAVRAPGVIPLEDAVGSVERTHLLEALRQTNWNISRAAARLGIPRNTLRYRIEKHGLRQEALAPHPEPAPQPVDVPAPAAPPAPPEPAPAGAAVRWERRRLALLRVVLLPPGDGPESRDPSRALAVLAEKVQGFSGRVVELGASGIVAAFGLEAIEDAPRRAAHAAMAIHKAAERDWGGRAAGIPVKSGIHAGQFLVGRLGRTVEIDQDAKRPAWAFLDTLVADAEVGTIIVSEAAAPFLERRFELLPVARERAAGRTYRLGRPEGSGFERGRSRFVGRHQELELLRGLFASAIRGQGQVVGIVGEAGIGKSRLLFEFRQSLAGEPVTYLEGYCVSYGAAIPYLPVLDLLRDICGITDADSPDTIRAKVDAALDGLGMAADEAAPYLLHLLGVKEGTSKLDALSLELINARTFETLRQMSLRGSRRRPIILVVEDLHWIDRTSEEYLASLVESFAGVAMLFVATYRPGYRPPWIEKSYATQVALQPLAPEPSLSVVRSVLGANEAAEPLVELILAKAEGNPFFLEELARTVREQGGLASALTVPDTIEEVILARIDRLTPDDKNLLQSAAVIGKDVPFSLLQAIAEVGDEELRGGLLRLRAAEFLYQAGPGVELEYSFKHTLINEVTYRNLLAERRRALHARIVAAIERQSAGRLGEHVERLAHHALGAEVWPKALEYARQAGAKAFTRSAHREAVAWFEQALEAARRLPETPERLAQAIDIRLDARTSLLPLGEFARIFGHLREAEAAATALGDQPRLGRILAYLTDYFRQVGEHTRAIDAGERSLTIAAAHGNLGLQVATHIYLGHVYHDMGEYRRAEEFLRRNVNILIGDLSRERFELPYNPAVHSRTWLVLCLSERGDFTEAVAKGEEARRLAESLEHPSSLTSAHAGLGRVYLRKGDLDKAIPLLEQGLELARLWSIRLLVPMLAEALGAAYALAGRMTEAITLLRQAVAQHAAMRGTAGQSVRLAFLAEAYLSAEQAADAIDLAQRALELAEAHRERGNQAYAHRLLGEIRSRGDAPEAKAAEAAYRQAIALADQLGMRPLLARSHLGLGGLYRRTGRRPEAEQELGTAAALLRDMNMVFWLERAENQLMALP